MLFPNIDVEETVQVNDRVRISAAKSFVSKDEADATSVYINPGTGNINVTGSSSEDWYLDWQFSASGTQTVSGIVANISGSALITATVSVLTSAQDYLFSEDDDLKTHEPDIMKWLPDGKNSYKNIHRRAQTLIMEWIKKEGFTDIENNAYTKAAIVDIEEVKQWATFIVLRLIFDGISNAKDDVFLAKSKYYKSQEIEWRDRAALKLDIDGDGVVDDGEQLDVSTGFIARR